MESWENLRGEIRYLWKSIPWKSIDNFINFVHIWKQKYSMAYLYVPNVPATYEISIDLYCMCKNITISAINEPDKIWPTSMKLGKQPMAWVRSLNFCFVTNVPIIVLISADMNKIWMNSRPNMNTCLCSKNFKRPSQRLENRVISAIGHFSCTRGLWADLSDN